MINNEKLIGFAGVWSVSIDNGYGEDIFLEKTICEAIREAVETK